MRNRFFDVGDRSLDAASKLFSVPDFIGDLCKAVASRIRGTVAGTNFDDFHKVIIIYYLALKFPCYCMLLFYL